MSDADTLRRAAALMRERANAATAGPWLLDLFGQAYVGNRADGRTHGLYDIVHASGDELSDLTPEWRRREIADAEHIASWHPPVALAVAAGIEGAAERWDDELADQLGAWNTRDYPWLVIATTYLGEVA